MTMQTTAAPKRPLRSAGALLAGFAAVVALSIGADEIMYAAHIFPPRDQPMHDPGLNLLALAYRTAFGALGSWIAAKLAPRAAMGHALALGVVGQVLSVLGVVAAVNMHIEPLWYPVLLAVLVMPAAWIGGRLAGR